MTNVGAAADYIQRSHMDPADVMYDLTHRWTVGGKYAYRLGQVAMDRIKREFFDSRANLYVLRATGTSSTDGTHWSRCAG